MKAINETEQKYMDRFATYSIERIKGDLKCNPLVMTDNPEFEALTEEELREVYFAVYYRFDQAMIQVIGESMFDDQYE